MLFRQVLNTLFTQVKACLWLMVSLFSLSAHGLWQSETQHIMGTEINLTLWHESTSVREKAIQAVMAKMNEIDENFSPYKESSALAQLNKKAAITAQPLSDEFVFLIDKSLYFSKMSAGAFDITFASLGWYYDYREKKKPSAELKKKLLPAINYRYLALDKKRKMLSYRHPNLRIDLGGLAKGYAVDQSVEILQRFGVKNASVSAGGDSRVLGDRRGRPWLVGIKNPRQGNKDDITVIKLPLTDTAISTSGDYERYFIDESSGEHIHHILNPKTGDSAREVVSVTVLGDQGVNTDPLSTSIFVLGVEQGLALADRMPGYDCIIIDKFGKVHYSAGLTSAN